VSVSWPYRFPDPKTLPDYFTPTLTGDQWDPKLAASLKKRCRKLDPTVFPDRLDIEAGLCVVVDGQYVSLPEITRWDRLLALVLV
jgi:hypothetical protein